MKRYILTIVFTCFIYSAIAQNSKADLGVAAIGFVVSDIDKSEDFYTQIVGMVPAGSFDISSDWSKEAGAANDRPFSVKMFKMVNGKSATILKLAYFDKMKPRPKQSGIDQFAGVNYLTFHYSKENFSSMLQRLDDAGIKKVGWVKKDNYQLLFIKDPDGVFIELVGPPDA